MQPAGAKGGGVEGSCGDDCCWELREVPGRGRAVFAARALARGEAVLEEEPVVRVLLPCVAARRCARCLTAATAQLQRCSGCQFARYCGRSCQKEDWRLHRTECKLLKTHRAVVDSLAQPERAESLMTLLLLRRMLTLGGSNDTVQAMCLGAALTDADARLLHYGMRLGFVTQAEISSGAAARLLRQFAANNFAVTDSILTPIGAGAFPRGALLNHDCAPNCVLSYVLKNHSVRMVIRTNQAVPAGTELCHSYVEQAQPTAQRQAILQHRYGFTCDCTRCAAAVHDDMAQAPLPFMSLDACREPPASWRDMHAILLAVRDEQERREDAAIAGAHDHMLTSHLPGSPSLSSSKSSPEDDSSSSATTTAAAEHAGNADMAEELRAAERAEAAAMAGQEGATDVAALRAWTSVARKLCRDEASQCGGIFHIDTYRAYGRVLSLALVCAAAGTDTDGTNEDSNGEDAFAVALEACEALCIFQAAVYGRYHPLLGVQLFTLGDLLRQAPPTEEVDDEGQSTNATKAYTIMQWAAHILAVTSGPESELAVQASQIAVELGL